MTTLRKTDLMTVAIVGAVDFVQHGKVSPKDVFINLGLVVGSKAMNARITLPTQIPQLNAAESILLAGAFAKNKLLDKKSLTNSAIDSIKLVGAQRIAYAIKDHTGLENHLL